MLNAEFTWCLLNSILRVEGRSDDMVLLRLIEAQCLPILTYGGETIHVADRNENRSMRVAYNSIYRRIFGYRHFESVTNLQHSLGRKTWEELVERCQAGFLHRAKSSDTRSLVWVLSHWLDLALRYDLLVVSVLFCFVSCHFVLFAFSSCISILIFHYCATLMCE